MQRLYRFVVSASSISVFAAATATAAPALEEVIVTAQKRAENLQQTPISIIAYSTAEIQKLRISDMMDLDAKIPNLSLPAFAIEMNSATPFIRGVGNVEMQISYDLAVGVYRDGVYLGRSSGFAADNADQQRIEVLRGPQGTLYGRNTTGGAINIVTNKPEQEFDMNASLGVGNRGLIESGVMLNVPITPTLAARAALNFSDDDGWFDNAGRGPNFGERKKKSGNLALRYTPVEQLTVDYVYDRSEVEGGQAAVQIDRARADPFGEFMRHDRMGTQSVRYQEPSHLKIDGHALTISWERDTFTLKSITAHRKIKELSYFDYSTPFHTLYDSVSPAAQAAVAPLLPQGTGPEGLDVRTPLSHKQFSQELQIVGQGLDNRLEYVAGLFYFEEEGKQNIFIRNNGLAGYTLAGFVRDGLAVASTRGSSEANSIAAYLQLSYKPALFDEKLKFTLGLRQTKDERDAKLNWTGYVTSDYAFNNGALVPFEEFSQKGNRESSKFTPALTVDYAFTPEISGYAKYSQGYRAGGFNLRSTRETFGDGFGPEEVTAYELGVKSDWLSQRLRVNVAVFDYSYEDIIVDQSVPTNIVASYTINAGEASISGAEVDITAVLSDAVQLTVNYGYLDTQYDSFIRDGVDVADSQHMPFSPRRSANVSLNYRMASFSVGDLDLWLNYNYRAAQYGNSGGETRIEPMGIYNASLTLSSIPIGSSKLSVEVWGKNLLDDEYTNQAVDFGTYTYVIYGQPRSYGLELRYQY